MADSLILLLSLFCLCTSTNYFKSIPEPILQMIEQYSLDFDSILLGKEAFESSLMLTSKDVNEKGFKPEYQKRYQLKCKYRLKQRILRSIIKSINPTIKIRDDICIKLFKEVGYVTILPMSLDHIEMFWKWFVLYRSNEAAYNKLIESSNYAHHVNALILENGICSLMFIGCDNINHPIHMLLLPSIINPTNVIYKVFKDGNDILSSITIDTRKHDNFGTLISNNIITNIDFNKLAFSPKLRLIIIGYNVEYKSNNIFPPLSVGRTVQIWFVPPRNQVNIAINLSNIKLRSPNALRISTFYHVFTFGEIGSRLFTYYKNSIRVILPTSNSYNGPRYRFSVFVHEKPCPSCNIWPSCNININELSIPLAINLNTFFRVKRYHYDGPLRELWHNIETFFDSRCSSFHFEDR